MFGEPVVNQYDSHMVMSGVIRPTKTQYINIDTKFREDTIGSGLASCNITLPQRITNIKSITVRDVEVPMSFYNISQTLKNNVFWAWTDASSQVAIVISDGNYTIADLKTAINAQISLTSLASKLSFDYVSQTAKSVLSTGNRNITVSFQLDTNKTPSPLMGSLGWILGFRQPEYTIPAHQSAKSEGAIQINTPKYLYLVLDEFSRGNGQSFMSSPEIRKQILAKIVLNRETHPFGTVLPANNYNGLLLSDTRQYHGQVDMLRIKVELVDDLGRVVDLNGTDFSFTLEATTY